MHTYIHTYMANAHIFPQDKATGLITKIIDASTFMLDTTASIQDAYYIGKQFTITKVPDGAEQRVGLDYHSVCTCTDFGLYSAGFMYPRIRL